MLCASLPDHGICQMSLSSAYQSQLRLSVELPRNDLVLSIRNLVLQSIHVSVVVSQMSHPLTMGPQWNHGAEMAMSAMSRDALGTGTS